MKPLDKFLYGSGTKTVAFRITIIYAILGSLWIAYSDQFLISIFKPDTVSEYALLQTYKGWFFILLTSTILFFLIINNVKKLRYSETLRHQTEREYRTIFENTGTAIVIIEADMTISLVNDKFVEITGYEKTEVEGKRKWIEFIHQDDLTKMIEYHRERRNKNDDIPSNYEFRLINKNNEIRHILISIALISGTQQSIASLIDITEKKDLEANYLRAQRMESIGTLSSGIAHDLNNILAPIMLTVEALKNSIADKKGERLLQITKSSAQRGSELVNQILTFSRGIQGDHLEIQPRNVMQEIGQIIQATFPKSIHLELHIPKDLWWISGNTTQIHQALLNICVNARDAMPDGGTLRIQAENITIHAENEHHHTNLEQGSYVLLSISDTGTGIPDEITDKLFSPFFTTKEEGEGTGLGLPTVEFIMRNHNGSIKVESEQDKGSTFKLYFPAIDVEHTGKEIHTKTPPQGKGEHLLVIDDEVAICEMISEILSSNNYNVMTAKDGAEGLAKYMKHKDKIDLILTDSNMPYLGGEKLIRSLKDANPDVKIFITTGSQEIKKQLQHLQPPVVGYLQKPYTTHTLLNQLREILNS